MAVLAPIEVIVRLQIRHEHRPLHQVLPMGIKPFAFASLQRFDQQIEQLSIGGLLVKVLVLLASCFISIGKT